MTTHTTGAIVRIVLVLFLSGLLAFGTAVGRLYTAMDPSDGYVRPLMFTAADGRKVVAERLLWMYGGALPYRLVASFSKHGAPIQGRPQYGDRLGLEVAQVTDASDKPDVFWAMLSVLPGDGPGSYYWLLDMVLDEVARRNYVVKAEFQWTKGRLWIWELESRTAFAKYPLEHDLRAWQHLRSLYGVSERPLASLQFEHGSSDWDYPPTHPGFVLHSVRATASGLEIHLMKEGVPWSHRVFAWERDTRTIKEELPWRFVR